MTSHIASTSIRPATSDDLAAILDMAREFWTYTRYPEAFDAEHVMVMIQGCMMDRLLLVVDQGRPVGFIAGLAMPLLGNAETIQVTELAYWINRDVRGWYGSKLLKAFEVAARARGATYLNMIAMESSMPEEVEKLYLHLGYTRSETTYTKRLED